MNYTCNITAIGEVLSAEYSTTRNGKAMLKLELRGEDANLPVTMFGDNAEKFATLRPGTPVVISGQCKARKSANGNWTNTELFGSRLEIISTSE